mmetsp:Transcript_60413/g.130938  ORF Transcript_60413/g.130938 Transcript_60413/m.130938 type:complete len:90 (+) Transcript_60413:807-1076(+)
MRHAPLAAKRQKVRLSAAAHVAVFGDPEPLVTVAPSLLGTATVPEAVEDFCLQSCRETFFQGQQTTRVLASAHLVAGSYADLAIAGHAR